MQGEAWLHAENIRCHHTKFSHKDDQAPGIYCTSDPYVSPKFPEEADIQKILNSYALELTKENH